MQITDTLNKIDIPKIDMPDFDVVNREMDKVNERIERFGQTAVTNYTETNARVVDAVVDTNRKVVDFAVKTAAAVTDAIDTPFADRIPTPAEAGKAYIDFVERAAEFNRDMNKRIIEMLPAAVQPVTAKPAAKPAAKKAPAKKRAAKKPAAAKKAAAATKAAATK